MTRRASIVAAAIAVIAVFIATLVPAGDAMAQSRRFAVVIGRQQGQSR